jgi:hypothetical protein
MSDERHWTEEFQHEKLATPEAKAEFVKICSAYKTPEDAILGGVEHKKMVGKKLENVIQRPDKDAKPEDMAGFRKSLLKELGSVEKEEDFKVNFAEGLAEGEKPDDATSAMYRKFAVANDVPLELAQKHVSLWNAIKKAERDSARTQDAEKMKSCNETLVKHFKTQEEVDRQSELFRQAIKNHIGLTKEEYEQFGHALADSVLTKNPVLAKVMLEHFAPLAAEGETNGGQGKKTAIPPKPTIKDELPKTAKALGWA